MLFIAYMFAFFSVSFFSLNLAAATSAGPHKICEKGQVYVSYENVSYPARDSYRLDLETICCPINNTEFQFSQPSNDTRYLSCCTGSEKPIYDTRYQKCIRAQVLPISDLEGASLHRICLKGQVYVSYENVSNPARSSYMLDHETICCLINETEFQFSQPSNDARYLSCCTGSEKPLYDTRYQKCIKGQVLPISDLESASLHRICLKGQVYVSYENVSNPARSSYMLDNKTICCPINETEFQFSQPSNDARYLSCCTGSEKPIYDTRYQKCIGAQVLPISDLESADNFKPRSSFKNYWYFQLKICSKIDGKQREKIATGILLIPTTSEKTEGYIHDFTFVGPMQCHMNSWFALPSKKFSDGNIARLERKNYLRRVCNDMQRFLNSYLDALNGTVFS